MHQYYCRTHSILLPTYGFPMHLFDNSFYAILYCQKRNSIQIFMTILYMSYVQSSGEELPLIWNKCDRIQRECIVYYKYAIISKTLFSPRGMYKLLSSNTDITSALFRCLVEFCTSLLSPSYVNLKVHLTNTKFPVWIVTRTWKTWIYHNILPLKYVSRIGTYTVSKK